jgi:hypothetical protein
MEESNVGRCEDKIEMDEELSEMSSQQLLTLRSIVLMCKDCGGCAGILKDIQHELDIRKVGE